MLKIIAKLYNSSWVKLKAIKLTEWPERYERRSQSLEEQVDWFIWREVQGIWTRTRQSWGDIRESWETEDRTDQYKKWVSRIEWEEKVCLDRVEVFKAESRRVVKWVEDSGINFDEKRGIINIVINKILKYVKRLLQEAWATGDKQHKIQITTKLALKPETLMVRWKSNSNRKLLKCLELQDERNRRAEQFTKWI